MYPSTEEQALIALKLIDGIGDRIGRKLIQHFGSATEIFHASKKSFLLESQFTPRMFDVLQNRSAAFDRANEELEFAKHSDVSVIGILDDRFPRRLRHCNDAPFVLFVKGTVDLNPDRVVSIVGTRSSSSVGRAAVEKLIAGFKGSNTLIVSGLAHGIDGTAHQEALYNDLSTVCVLAHGLDRIYPPEHRAMAHEMLERGGWVSDFLSETNPDRGNFPERNRIVAGMSDALVVVESKRKGGSMISAELAYGYNRDVFAFPGRFNDQNYEGCNYLISSQQAQLITSAEDMCHLMNWNEPSKTVTQPKLLFDLTPEEEQILHLLRQQEQLSLDELAGSLSAPVSTLSIHLLNLELNGQILVHPGKVYSLR